MIKSAPLLGGAHISVMGGSSSGKDAWCHDHLPEEVPGISAWGVSFLWVKVIGPMAPYPTDEMASNQ